MALALIKNSARLGVAGGAVYLSVQQGVWGTAEEGAKTMKRLTDLIMPGDGFQIPKPTFASGDGILQSAWNKGSRVVFENLRDVPEMTEKAKTYSTQLVKDSFSK